MRKKIAALRSKVKARDKKIATLGDKIQSMEQTNQQKFIQSLPSSAQAFIQSQLQASGRSKMGRRWSIAEKKLAITLYHSSPKTYKILRQLFVLPSTLKRTLKNINMQAGFNNQMMDVFKSIVSKLSDSDRLCTVIFYEMAIKEYVSYSMKDDKVVGYEDFGSFQTKFIANHATVFMVRGIVSPWKQPLFVTSDRKNCEDDVDHFLINLATMRKHTDKSSHESSSDDPNACEIISPTELPQDIGLQSQNVVTYIGGFIVKKLKNKLCPDYVHALTGNIHTESPSHALLQSKQYSKDCTVGSNPLQGWPDTHATEIISHFMPGTHCQDSERSNLTRSASAHTYINWTHERQDSNSRPYILSPAALSLTVAGSGSDPQQNGFLQVLGSIMWLKRSQAFRPLLGHRNSGDGLELDHASERSLLSLGKRAIHCASKAGFACEIHARRSGQGTLVAQWIANPPSDLTGPFCRGFEFCHRRPGLTTCGPSPSRFFTDFWTKSFPLLYRRVDQVLPASLQTLEPSTSRFFTDVWTKSSPLLYRRVDQVLPASLQTCGPSSSRFFTYFWTKSFSLLYRRVNQVLPAFLQTCGLNPLAAARSRIQTHNILMQSLALKLRI
ncbi:transposable element p transposase [Plakobranchus ocellatus]|uniref:Transposable element p transposase n=1 Tax=Plakobranchus ocellatus TaxID=259542 RepID=A0AAV4BAD6_9GAST|nr:transposable element p transposase [Plakobranchus ocellatus]